MKTRFAPSPTGYLHIGNIRTALLCYLYAKKTGGTFMLRIDDTDSQRSKQEYTDAIIADMQWLGIVPDEVEYQSRRFDRYHLAVEKLKESGRLYACYETEQELDMKRKMQLSRGIPPIYDREGMRLTEDMRCAFEKEGRKAHWRFCLEDRRIQWNDEIRGNIVFESKNLSDPILIRENGAYTYMLPSTVDDIELGVTNVLRGEDHISNTAIQIELFEALGGDVPKFGHNALIKSAEGKLSKRYGSKGVRDLRSAGIEPMAVNSFLAKIGSSDPVELRTCMLDLVEEFDVNKFGRSPTIYSFNDIERLNVKLLHNMSFEDVREELNEMGLCEVDDDFWLAVRGNIDHISDVKDWWKICKEPLEPVVEDGDFLINAAKELPEGDWDENTWDSWISKVKLFSGRKGKALFMPLRKALTGVDNGPELKVMLPLIGRQKAEDRLNGKTA